MRDKIKFLLSKVFSIYCIGIYALCFVALVLCLSQKSTYAEKQKSLSDYVRTEGIVNALLCDEVPNDEGLFKATRLESENQSESIVRILNYAKHTGNCDAQGVAKEENATKLYIFYEDNSHSEIYFYKDSTHVIIDGVAYRVDYGGNATFYEYIKGLEKPQVYVDSSLNYVKMVTPEN